MTVARLAVSFDSNLAKAVRRAARGQPTSTWLADAAERKLRAEGLLAAVSEWESEFGVIERSELNDALKRQRPSGRK